MPEVHKGSLGAFLKKNVFCIFVFLLWFLLLKQTSIAIFAMTLPCSAVFYRYENVVKCKACVSSIRERADKNQQRSTNHDSLFVYLLLIQFLFVSLFLFFTDIYGCKASKRRFSIQDNHYSENVKNISKKNNQLILVHAVFTFERDELS